MQDKPNPSQKLKEQILLGEQNGEKSDQTSILPSLVVFKVRAHINNGEPWRAIWTAENVPWTGKSGDEEWTAVSFVERWGGSDTRVNSFGQKNKTNICNRFLDDLGFWWVLSLAIFGDTPAKTNITLEKLSF